MAYAAATGPHHRTTTSHDFTGGTRDRHSQRGAYRRHRRDVRRLSISAACRRACHRLRLSLHHAADGMGVAERKGRRSQTRRLHGRLHRHSAHCPAEFRRRGPAGSIAAPCRLSVRLPCSPDTSDCKGLRPDQPAVRQRTDQRADVDSPLGRGVRNRPPRPPTNYPNR